MHFIAMYLNIFILLQQMFFSTLLQTQEKQIVPIEFKYPESPTILQIDKTIKSNSLSGIITDPSGLEMDRVLIEILEAGWKKRKNATFTNSQGFFAFEKVPLGIYFLKISKPGFDTMLLKIKVTKSIKTISKINIKLVVSN